MDRQAKTLEEIGKLMAGLAVPVSMPNSRITLGTAYDPWKELHIDLVGSGWHAPEKYSKHLAEALGLSGGGACCHGVYWWDGEYEGQCERPQGHPVPNWHFDGMSWYNSDNESVTVTDEQAERLLLGDRIITLTRALSEAKTETARVKAQLDQYEGRKVFHTQEKIFEQQRQELISAQAELEPGAVLRATDTGREEIWNGKTWEPR